MKENGKFNSLEERAEKFFTDLEDSQGLALLEQIRAQRRESRFKVCVAGEFSKGKTHLINQMLEVDILPESSIPTTTTLTEISYGEKALRFEDIKEKRGYDLDWDKLEEFSAEGERADAAGMLRVSYPARILKPNLVLYDTPGVDDVLSRRAEIAYNALGSCDAALVAVSALTPLSLSEKSFLDAYLNNRAIPKIAIVITFLDKIAPHQRENQLTFLVEKIKSQYPDIEIWTSFDAGFSSDISCRVAGFEAMRGRLREWQIFGDIEESRRRRDLLRLKNQIDLLAARQNVLLENLKADANERRQAFNKAYAALDENNEIWRAINDELVRKGDLTVEDLRERIDAAERECHAALDKDGPEIFAASLRTKLRQTGAKMAEETRARMKDDRLAALRRLQEQLGIDTLAGLGTRFENFDILIRDDALALPEGDIQEDNFLEAFGLLKLLKNFGDIFSGPFIDLLPLPPAAKAPVKIAAAKVMKILREWLEDGQPRRDKEAMRELVSSFCAQLRLSIADVTREIYKNMSKAIRKEQYAWLETQRAALRRAHETNSAKEAMDASKQYIATAKELSADIVAAMEDK